MAAQEEQPKGPSIERQVAEAGAKKGIKFAAKRIGTRVAARFAAAKAIGTAIGSIALPGVGTAVGGLIGSTVGQLVSKKNIKRALYAGLAIPGGILAFGGILVMAILGSVGAVAASIGISILGAIIAMPILIAFFLFIINSGAYIVPPSPTAGFQSVESFKCLNFRGPWPESSLQTYVEAAGIISRHPRYIQNLCAAGTIQITYNPNQVGDFGGRVVGGKMEIFERGTGSLGNSLYTFAHELGHVYAGRQPAKLSLYDTNVYTGDTICTYPFGTAMGESFAEMISLYSGGLNPPGGFAVGADNINRLPCLGTSFRDGVYSDHWEFAKDNIFFSTAGW